jgi:hypothetical protein
VGPLGVQLTYEVTSRGGIVRSSVSCCHLQEEIEMFKYTNLLSETIKGIDDIQNKPKKSTALKLIQ